MRYVIEGLLLFTEPVWRLVTYPIRRLFGWSED